jgi:hypothetical protein
MIQPFGSVRGEETLKKVETRITSDPHHLQNTEYFMVDSLIMVMATCESRPAETTHYREYSLDSMERYITLYNRLQIRP